MEIAPSHSLSFEAAAAMLPDRWIPEAKLASGGMSVVLKARDTLDGSLVAVKILCVTARKAERALSRFQRELSTCLALNHPNIVRILGGECCTECCYIVMELLDGFHELRLLVKEHKFSASDIVHIVVQLALAVEFLHDQGIIHRDVKPENLMVDHHLQLKLMDLGLIKIIGEKSTTKVGTLVGTPRYLAPEVVQGGKTTPAVDLYSIGLVAYELFTGCRAFPQKNLTELMKAIVKGDFPNPHKLQPQLPEALAEIITRAIARVPALRYDSTRSLLRELAHLGLDGTVKLYPKTEALLNFGIKA